MPAGSTDEVIELMSSGHYVCEPGLATAIFLALRLKRPLLLEGEAGVGKTEVAKVLAAALGRRLIRLQCYEGLDVASAVYEWNYARQMMAIRVAEARGKLEESWEQDIYSERYLVRRPLLEALSGGPVLLIDELDRTDEPFEAFLLELLSDFQLTIPELGTLVADEPPIVLITSNRTREIHDALKRRCLYHWIDYPDAEQELAILTVKLPEARQQLLEQVVSFVQRLRRQDMFKAPGVAESIDWTQALMALDQVALTPHIVNRTLGVLLKYQDDIRKIRGQGVESLLTESAAAPTP